MADEVLRERRGHVEILTINRPEARNAINRATAVALGEALDACERDDDVWVVVLTGADDKAFSAGMDLKAFARGEFPSTEKGFAGITQRDFPKPLIAAANGSALAGGIRDSDQLRHGRRGRPREVRHPRGVARSGRRGWWTDPPAQTHPPRRRLRDGAHRGTDRAPSAPTNSDS